jgi:hypothetical protein
VSHYSASEWEQYVEGTLQEVRQTMMENHLYHCDECLAHYLIAKDQLYLEVPETPEHNLDDLLNGIGAASVGKKQRTHMISPIWHYVIAASLTMTLMSSGLFQQAAGAWREAEINLAKKQADSITDTLMDRTLSILDRLQSAKQEG